MKADIQLYGGPFDGLTKHVMGDGVTPDIILLPDQLRKSCHIYQRATPGESHKFIRTEPFHKLPEVTEIGRLDA